MPARERSSYKEGIGIFSHDLIIFQKWRYIALYGKRIIRNGGTLNFYLFFTFEYPFTSLYNESKNGGRDYERENISSIRGQSRKNHPIT